MGRLQSWPFFMLPALVILLIVPCAARFNAINTIEVFCLP